MADGAASIEPLAIGDERQTVVVIDDAAPDPEALRAAAMIARFGPALHAYPGIRADLPADYWPAQQAVIARAIAGIGLGGGALSLIDASFSIVTAQRDALSVSQRLPHCDSHDAGRIAFVHYLDPAEAGGGTGFFRHRSTRFETVDGDRAPIYAAQLDAELRYGGLPPLDYVGGEDRLFTLIGSVAPRFNRTVVYRSFALHSGLIPAGATLSSDPRDGRLTITGFLHFDRVPPASPDHRGRSNRPAR